MPPCAEAAHTGSPLLPGLSKDIMKIVGCQQQRVRFQEGRSIRRIESSVEFSDATRKLLWYSEDEIETCRTSLRELTETIIGNGRVQEKNARGLELKLSPARQRRKYMIIHAILKAQRRYTRPKQLAKIACKCTVWSKAAAVIIAQHDYCEVYHPERLESIANVPPLEKYPLPFKSKEQPMTPFPIKRSRSPVPEDHRVRPRQPQQALSC